MNEIPALSVRQPWAELILQGRKRIELRSWSTPYRGVVWLHTGRAKDGVRIDGVDEPLFRGGYVGSVRLVSVVPLDEARWRAWEHLHFAGPFQRKYFGWVLDQPLRFQDPIPARGRLRLFYPDEETVALLRVAHDQIKLDSES